MKKSKKLGAVPKTSTEIWIAIKAGRKATAAMRKNKGRTWIMKQSAIDAIEERRKMRAGYMDLFGLSWLLEVLRRQR